MRFCALPDAGTDGGENVSSGLIEMHIAWTLELKGVITVLRLVLEIPTALMVGLPSMT
jgi:hypothetical protein